MARAPGTGACGWALDIRAQQAEPDRMSEAAELRRHLYEQYAGLRRRDWRARGRLRRQIALLASTRPGPRDDGGPSGVREPRRPRPPVSGASWDTTRSGRAATQLAVR